MAPLAITRPVAIHLDPLRACGSPRGQRELQDRNLLPGAAAFADRYDLLVLGDVNPCDYYRNTEDLRLKRDLEIFFDHGVKTRGLLRFVITVDDRFFYERVQLGFA